MENEKKNLIETLHERRVQNFKQQLRQVLLEGYEIFGSSIVDSIISDCQKIYDEYINLTPVKSDE